MSTINKKKICNKCQSFYDAIENTSCPLCKKINNDTYDKTIRKSERVKIYNSRKWKQVREQAMLRDGLMCKVCEANNISTMADEVHHIQYLEHRIDLAYELDNLISICRACHKNIHAKDR